MGCPPRPPTYQEAQLKWSVLGESLQPHPTKGQPVPGGQCLPGPSDPFTAPTLTWWLSGGGEAGEGQACKRRSCRQGT